MIKNALALPSRSELAAPLEELVERARGYAADSRAPATRRAYHFGPQFRHEQP